MSIRFAPPCAAASWSCTPHWRPNRSASARWAAAASAPGARSVPRSASSAAITPTHTAADVPNEDDGGTAAVTRRRTSHEPTSPASRTASAIRRCSGGSEPTVNVTPKSSASTTTNPTPGAAVASTDTPGPTARLHTCPCRANQVSVQPPTSQTRTGTRTVTLRDTPAVWPGSADRDGALDAGEGQEPADVRVGAADLEVDDPGDLADHREDGRVHEPELVAFQDQPLGHVHRDQQPGCGERRGVGVVRLTGQTKDHDAIAVLVQRHD